MNGALVFSGGRWSRRMEMHFFMVIMVASRSSKASASYLKPHNDLYYLYRLEKRAHAIENLVYLDSGLRLERMTFFPHYRSLTES
jgi:hypothetical protein